MASKDWTFLSPELPNSVPLAQVTFETYETYEAYKTPILFKIIQFTTLFVKIYKEKSVVSSFIVRPYFFPHFQINFVSFQNNCSS